MSSRRSSSISQSHKLEPTISWNQEPLNLKLMTDFVASLFLSPNCISINLFASKHVLKMYGALNGSQMLNPSTEHPKDNRQLDTDYLHPSKAVHPALRHREEEKVIW